MSDIKHLIHTATKENSRMISSMNVGSYFSPSKVCDEVGLRDEGRESNILDAGISSFVDRKSCHAAAHKAFAFDAGNVRYTGDCGTIDSVVLGEKVG